MRADRLFGIVFYLMNNDKATAVELARRFEVSARTIFRDIDALSASGVPIYCARGRGGGVFLLERFTMERAAFTKAEQDEILCALEGMKAANYPDSRELLSKLRALFGSGETGYIDVDFAAWGIKTDYFDILRRAIMLKRTVEFNYVDAYGEESRRRVEPMKLKFKGRSWYLYGYCQTRRDMRVFKLKRISGLELTQDTFTRGLDDFPVEPDISPGRSVSYVLRFSPAVAHRVYDEFVSGSIAKNPDGSLEVSVNFPPDEWVCGYFLSFGPYLEVREPKDMREEIALKARAILQVYNII